VAKKQIAVIEPDDNKKKTTKEPKKDVGGFFDDLLKSAKIDIPIASKNNEASVTGYFSTGSLVLNGLLSGTLDGGFANNKIVALAGEEATGKTFIALQACKTFLEINPRGQVFYFDSEDAISSEMMEERGIDIRRVRKTRVNTVQEFRHSVINILDSYLEYAEADRLPMFMVLDSLGNLSTSKEMKDIKAGALNKKGDDVRDMTRTSLIKGLFRVIAIKLGQAKVGMLLTNHTYESMDPYGAKRVMGGGAGLKYAASTIVHLGKKKLRDAKKEVIGSILTAVLDKSRFTRPGKSVDLLLSHATGLNRYWGLFDLAKENKFFLEGKENDVKANFYKFPDGQVGSRKQIDGNPAKYFDTPVNYDAFNELAGKVFKFGLNEVQPAVDYDDDSVSEDASDDADYEANLTEVGEETEE